MLSSVDWHPIETAASTDIAKDYFCYVVNGAIAECVPPYRPAPKPPWSNARLRKLKRLRSAALRKYSTNRNVYMKQQFCITSKDYRNYNQYLYNRYVRRMQEQLRRNPKQFWTFVKSKRKDAGLPRAMVYAGRSATNAQEKCELFASHFKTAFNSVLASNTQAEFAVQNTIRDAFVFDSFDISTLDVTAAIQKLKQSFAIGPDGIPACVLKAAADTLVYPLALLFNRSLQRSTFPSRWKFSYMFLVYKKGDKCNVANYRGITSLCACSKVFEIIVHKALFESSKNYVSEAQHGFYPKRSVATNLVQFVSLCRRTIDSGAQIDAVYTDLKAAFDRVDHRILLRKLEVLGVSNSYVAWFSSYLTNRRLQVKIGSSLSVSFTNLSGVPQGSNLGPLLFSLFINDLANVLPENCLLMFADDTKLFKVIHSSLDCLVLQNLINVFYEWCSSNFLTVSIEKCNAISFHRKRNPLIFNYVLSNKVLERVNEIKDLGVILDSELSFRAQYSDVVRRGNRQLGFVCKIAKEFRDPYCLRALYYSLVRPMLETNAVVWSPYHAVWIRRLEAVQSKFVRYALRFLPWRENQNMTAYTDRCRLLGIQTLEGRRRSSQAIFVAKVLTGRTDAPNILSQLNVYAPERRIRQREFLQLETRNTDYGYREPIRFMSSVFNECFYLFDFNVSIETFRVRLRTS